MGGRGWTDLSSEARPAVPSSILAVATEYAVAAAVGGGAGVDAQWPDSACAQQWRSRVGAGQARKEGRSLLRMEAGAGVLGGGMCGKEGWWTKGRRKEEKGRLREGAGGEVRAGVEHGVELARQSQSLGPPALLGLANYVRSDPTATSSLGSPVSLINSFHQWSLSSANN